MASPRQSVAVGDTFGLLTVVRRGPKDRWRRAMWECLCACGNSYVTSGKYLRNAEQPNCGCVHYAIVSESVTKYVTARDYLANTVRNGSCLEWQGHLTSAGYATAGKYDGKYTERKEPLVHRRVYRLVYGESPPVVMHTCDNRKCINPRHLRGGSQKENIRDAYRKGRLNSNKLRNNGCFTS